MSKITIKHYDIVESLNNPDSFQEIPRDNYIEIHYNKSPMGRVRINIKETGEIYVNGDRRLILLCESSNAISIKPIED